MANMSLKKNEMPSQAPDVRSGNFLEVALGYTEEQLSAMHESGVYNTWDDLKAKHNG